jgi:hypothetical protein
MGVWAAFGPYESAEDAERFLCRSIRAVFGESNVNEHSAWIAGHAENFRMWEESGTLKQSIKFMRRGLAAFAVGPDFETACDKFKEDSRAEALGLLDKITTEFGMEKQAPALRALIDGSMPPEQIQEELQASQEENAERIIRGVGEKILHAPSQEAARMRQFLQKLSREHMGDEATTPEAFGLLYLNCINYAGDNAGTEFAKAFLALDDEWRATLPHEKTDANTPQPPSSLQVRNGSSRPQARVPGSHRGAVNDKIGLKP